MWTPSTILNAGDWVMADVRAAISLDFGQGPNEYDLLNRANEYAAAGALPVVWQRVIWDRGVIFGAGSSLRIIGRVSGSVPAEAVANSLAGSVDSFWSVIGASALIYSAQGGAEPPLPGVVSNPWASALSWVSAAAVIVAIAVIVVNVRKGLQ
jgi:hypothetical protein